MPNSIGDTMKIDVYGFQADVSISNKWYVGEIPELHIIEQAKTLRALEDRLKGGVEDVVDAVKKNPAKYRKFLSQSTFNMLNIQVMAYA
jgi:hypothetical protein